MTEKASFLPMKDGAQVNESAIKTVFNGLAAHTEPDRQEWVTMLCTTAISVLHGTYGREFTEGYLRSALASLDDPSQAAAIIVTERPLQ